MIVRLINDKEMAHMQIETMLRRLKEEFTLAQQRWITQQYDETSQEDKKRALILLSGHQQFYTLAIDLQFDLELILELANGKSSNESSKRKD